MKTRIVSAAMLVLLATAIAGSRARGQGLDLLGPGVDLLGRRQARDVPPIYKPFYDDYFRGDWDAVRAALPYEQVTLQLSGGMVVPGGWFKITLAKSGEAALWSPDRNGFGPPGDFVGRVNLLDFGKLSQFIDKIQFSRLVGMYQRNMTDLQTLTLTVSTANNTAVVVDYGGVAPVEIWSLEQAVEAIGHRIAWRPK